MPDLRFRSPRAGHGRKTSSLTDFEYRVWDQWQLSADDFGVMRLDPLKIQSENRALAQRQKEDVQAALERIVVVGLALAFEHQGDRFLCDPTWQEFQTVEYPRKTDLPRPDAETLAQCGSSTVKLFKKHPGGRPKKPRTRSGASAHTSRRASKHSPNRSQTSPEQSPNSRARVTRETANANARANGSVLTPSANGSARSSRPTPAKAQLAPVAALRAEFNRLHLATVGAKANFAGRKDDERLGTLWRERLGDPVTVEALMAAFFRSEDPFVLRVGRSVGVFVSQVPRLLPDAARAVAAAPPPAETWSAECRRLHARSCNGRLAHSHRMACDAEKAQATA